ncbi:MAG: hypothetical protein JWR60_3396 [Polaromonas sp.]|nr:hypothetical protein [Polaromonas sp.]
MTAAQPAIENFKFNQKGLLRRFCLRKQLFNS